MSYTIQIGKSKQAEVEVQLDGNVPTEVPPHVGLGIGNKAARYEKHLQKCFADNAKLLNYLAFIHKTGKEKGSITLVCRCHFSKFHAQKVKEFLENNKELLDTCLPYIFPNEEGYKAKDYTDGVLPDDLKSQLGSTPGMEGFGPMNGKVNLPPGEMAQIQELIRLDQEREALLHAGETTNTVDIATIRKTTAGNTQINA